ncbi:helix-turn-helix domain-containing protein [Streptomyces sp. NPDC002845]
MSLPRLLYTAKEVADALGVSAYWVCEQARNGRIPAQKVAGAWRLSRAQMDALMKQIEQTAAPEPQEVAPAAARPRRTRQPQTQPAPVVRLVAKPPRRRVG